jgi:hypothetical protein
VVTDEAGHGVASGRSVRTWARAWAALSGFTLRAWIWCHSSTSGWADRGGDGLQDQVGGEHLVFRVLEAALLLLAVESLRNRPALLREPRCIDTRAL